MLSNEHRDLKLYNKGCEILLYNFVSSTNWYSRMFTLAIDLNAAGRSAYIVRGWRILRGRTILQHTGSMVQCYTVVIILVS